MSLDRTTSVLIAAVIPVTLMAAYVWAAHAFYFPRPAAMDWVAFFVFMLVGILAIWFGPWAPRVRAGLIALYVPLAFVALFAAGLMTACSMGDCI